MKLDDRFDALARTQVPDQWLEISEREPQTRSDGEGPSRLRRAGIALLALTVAGAGFVYAVKAFGGRAAPGSSTTPDIGDSYSIETVLEREGLIDVAFGEGSVWATTLHSVVRLDATTSEIQAEIPVDKGFDIAVGEDGVWVTRNYEGGIDVVHIDPATNEVVSNIPVPSYCVAVGEGAVWTTSGWGSDLTEIDPATDEVVATVPIDPGVDGRGVGCVAAGAGGVWVTRGGDADALLRIDPQTHDVVATIDVPNDDLADAIVADGNDVWIAVPQHWDQNGQPLVMLHRVDPATNQVTASLAVGESSGLEAGEHGASSVRVAVGDGLVWVETGSHLFGVDPNGGDVVASLPGDGGGSIGTFGLAVGDGAVWAVVADTIRRGVLGVEPSPSPAQTSSLAPAEPKQLLWTALQIPDIAQFPNAIAVGDGAVWAIAPSDEDPGRGDIVHLDPSSGNVLGRIPVKHLPTWESAEGGLAVGGGGVWSLGVAHLDGEVHTILDQIDPVTNEVVDEIDIGPGSVGDVWVDGPDVWVVHFTDVPNVLEVVRLDLAEHRVLARIPIPGEWSQEIFVVGNSVWVSALTAGSDDSFGGPGSEHLLLRVDAATNTFVEQISCACDVSITLSGDLFWAGVEGGLQRFDATTGELIGNVIAVPPGRGVMLSDGAGGVWFIDPTTPVDQPGFEHIDGEGRIVGTGEIDGAKDESSWSGIAYAFDPATDSIWVAHYKGSVSRIQIG